jgi:UDP-glucose 4-epimerase
MQNILVTGGLGFIGSHTVTTLLNNNLQPIIIDNLSNSNLDVLKKIKNISGVLPKFFEGDIRDEDFLSRVLFGNKIDAVFHFAGLKDVSDSVKNPNKYYDVNVNGSKTLIKQLEKFNIKKIIFSSSATIYGEPKILPIPESHPIDAINPYGDNKIIVEGLLEDLCEHDEKWKAISLRYFNPIGAHPSGLLGEAISKKISNIMPHIINVALRKVSHLDIYGNDYDTKDGTGVRDYIHIMDLVDGHIAALLNLDKQNRHNVFNLGTGKGISVLELVKAFEEVSNQEIPYQFTKKRKGDLSISYADPSKAYMQLGWKAKKGLIEMCEDAFRWLCNEKINK